MGGGLGVHSLAELTQAVADLLQVLLQFGLLPQQMLLLTGLQRQQEQRGNNERLKTRHTLHSGTE